MTWSASRCAMVLAVCGPILTTTGCTTITRNWWTTITRPNIFPKRRRRFSAKVPPRPKTGTTSTARNSKEKTAPPSGCCAAWTTINVQPSSPSLAARLDTEQTFFARNAHRMAYADFRQNGWPIGSGPVEAACKSVVKTRLCRSGMRWSRDGGQHILSLRTYVKSNRWNAMWKQYKHIEQPRSPCNTT